MSQLDKALCRRVAAMSRRQTLSPARKFKIRQLVRGSVRLGQTVPRA